VVRPDMQRKDVTEFRKRLRQPDQSKRAKLGCVCKHRRVEQNRTLFTS
jgi:hypothetical protein